MEKYILGEDTISGREGKVMATIDGKVYELFELTKFTADIELDTTEIKPIGVRHTETKVHGIKGTGTFSGYYVSSKYRDIILDYYKTGKMPQFKAVVVNEDPASKAGRQEIMIEGITITKSSFGMLDNSAGALTEDVPFNFRYAKILKTFDEVI